MMKHANILSTKVLVTKIKRYDIYLLQYFVAKELAKMEKIKIMSFVN
ncbi:Uncharacterised protein [Listeria monocytogenes]|nr:hypothetical protein [Listeria monocytogenes]STY92868.1 Uncharacterised protein [Listeria monocytogenes]